MDLEFEIFLFIENQQKLNGNKCGINTATLSQEFSVDFKDLKPILNKLHKEKKIIVREGLNSSLIFLNKTK